MKKFYPLLPVLFLIFWSCEDEVVEDTTPPTVTITTPQDGSTVNEIVTITCISSDNEGVDKVELWVNGVTTILTDDSEPYSFDWNTTLVDNGNYTITVRSYDLSGNTTDSEPTVLTVDNTQSNPTPVVLYPITYDEGFKISWSKNNDYDFHSYKVYESLYEDMSDKILLYDTGNRTDTIYSIEIEVLKYYQIIVEDLWGYQSQSNIKVGDYNFEFWGESYSVLNTTNIIFGLFGGTLTGSIPPEIGNLTNLTSLILINNQLTGFIPPELGNLTNLTNLNLSYNQLTGEIPSELGNLTNLISMNLSDNQLTGSIPPELGNLTYIINFQGGLDLSSNQLSGVIPDELCNVVGVNNSGGVDIQNNVLCPPYPSCIEDYVGEQDTSDCD